MVVKEGMPLATPEGSAGDTWLLGSHVMHPWARASLPHCLSVLICKLKQEWTTLQGSCEKEKCCIKPYIPNSMMWITHYNNNSIKWNVNVTKMACSFVGNKIIGSRNMQRVSLAFCILLVYSDTFPEVYELQQHIYRIITLSCGTSVLELPSLSAFDTMQL